MKDKHTPGEWKINDLHEDSDRYIIVYGEDQSRIALCFETGDATYSKNENRCLANAELIASAPSLLEENAKLRQLVHDRTQEKEQALERVKELEADKESVGKKFSAQADQYVKDHGFYPSDCFSSSVYDGVVCMVGDLIERLDQAQNDQGASLRGQTDLRIERQDLQEKLLSSQNLFNSLTLEVERSKSENAKLRERVKELEEALRNCKDVSGAEKFPSFDWLARVRKICDATLSKPE